MIRTLSVVAVIGLAVTVATAQQNCRPEETQKDNGDQAKIGTAMAKGDAPFDLATAHKIFATFEEVYTTFHHPNTQANVVTTEYSDWATNCPEYKVTAVQVTPSNGPTEWQEKYEEFAHKSRRIAATVEAAE